MAYADVNNGIMYCDAQEFAEFFHGFARVDQSRDSSSYCPDGALDRVVPVVDASVPGVRGVSAPPG